MKRRIVTAICLCLVLITAVACFGSNAASPPKPVSQRPALDVQDFVRGTYFHGLPYEEASKYDSADMPVLLEMLQDSKEMVYWPTIVGTLGAIGDEQAVDPLISFLEEDVSGTLSREHYIAKTAVLKSLGYLVNKSGSQKALTYLKDSLDAQVWDQRALMFESPHVSSTTQRNEQLISPAIIGLALSGHPEAREALLAFQQGIGSDSRFNSLIAEALDAHEIIAREGLAAYYQK